MALRKISGNLKKEIRRVRTPRTERRPRHEEKAPEKRATELVIITGMSGSGKASALKAFEDLGYYCVDNLPVDLIPRFAELALQSGEIPRTALVVDVREGSQLERLPALGTDTTVKASLTTERRHLRSLRALADMVIDTSKFNVHELRAHLTDRFKQQSGGHQTILVSCVSFGYRHGVPDDADLVFDVRFLPNPHFVPEFRPLTGKHPKVAKYVRQFPQTKEFLDRTADLLRFLLTHYIAEGKSYLTVAFGCTGGQHRSVFIAEEMKKRLGAEGYRVKTAHRDM